MKLIITYILIMLTCLNIASRASASEPASQYERCKKVSGEDAQILKELVLGDDAPQAYQYLTESLELTGECLNRWIEWLGLNQWLEKKKLLNKLLNMVPEHQQEGE